MFTYYIDQYIEKQENERKRQEIEITKNFHELKRTETRDEVNDRHNLEIESLRSGSDNSSYRYMRRSTSKYQSFNNEERQ